MRTSRQLTVSTEDKAVLERYAKAPSTAQKIALRARIVLMSGEGEQTGDIVAKLGTSVPTVTRWRNRYEESGATAILKDADRRGRPRRITAGKVADVVNRTLHEKPPGATHWSTRTLAPLVGLSHTQVHRIWRDHGLKPHRIDTFKLSTDPQFLEKLHDVVGLYLDPPEKAVVFSVDEKSQVQALDRTQPGLPMKQGRAETRTHDYKRHGTTTLFAALAVATGEVIGECKKRHRHDEFLSFLKRLERETSTELELHLIVDNYATHKHPHVRAWLERHPRVHLHFTPTSSSWLNLVERFFAEITDKAIRRGVFKSVRDLEDAIGAYLDMWNDRPCPYTWTKSAEQIIEKVGRARRSLDITNDNSGTGH